MPSYNQSLPFCEADCFLPRSLHEAFGTGASIDLENDILIEDLNALEATLIIVIVSFLVLAFFPTRDSINPQLHCAQIAEAKFFPIHKCVSHGGGDVSCFKVLQ